MTSWVLTHALIHTSLSPFQVSESLVEDAKEVAFAARHLCVFL